MHLTLLEVKVKFLSQKIKRKRNFLQISLFQGRKEIFLEVEYIEDYIVVLSVLKYYSTEKIALLPHRFQTN